MGKKYHNPPVVEAVCEFRFSSNSPWDLTVPGLIYDRIKTEFPHKKQVLAHGIKEVSAKEGIGPQIEINKLMQFFSDDKSKLIQVGPQLVSINCLRPYPTWKQLRPLIERIHQVIFNVIEEQSLERIGLRYVNRIIIPEKKIEIEDFFQFRPFKGDVLPDDMVGFHIGCVFPFHDERDLCQILLKSVPTSDPESLEFHFDLDYFTRLPQCIPFNQTTEWVDIAHQHNEELFEGCITEKLRQIFQEVK